ncbi:hypothetical protein [Algiphilus sp.]|uniref:hypothetical protein n=2 Tax=Algiphilus sp. TaxID=1872431 RepID=UPI0025BA0C29|nr:hypothetical protein [Algiphilus sp.]MCI5061985.1 hypothetical protein [Algiphilus sp.]
MRVFAMAMILVASVWGGVATAEKAGTNHYALDGALEGRFGQAKCRLYFSKYGKNWTLQLVPENAYSPAANLFFSPKFGNPAPGSFPVQFAYRNSAASLGGSVSSDGATFSYETQGEVEFTRFDERVVGSFSFVAQDDDGASVTAEGAFDCPRGEMLR